ncbi:hypothetical protein GWI33_001595 [Rhynchophorus ferrugineus]|uniref:Ankyrin repeat and MYND domain-containing protein 1 n=1 Tax=Rhynchophorus ferrugineus TaxID=354439 RepID=A0A834IQ61_RHYFE|nr:hypothetical protein GWI33_001595 [Rhynchophorus ferrugineus]
MSSDIDEPKSIENVLSHIPFSSYLNEEESCSVRLSNIRSNCATEKSSCTKEFKNITCEDELFEGTVLLNNLHGLGFYTNRKYNDQFCYSGPFYLNRFEGYGQVFYSNGFHYQGLFKAHKRFGPGILTYPDGSTDVGIWNGFKLIRLSTTIGNGVQNIVKTALGRSKLLIYKYLVPVVDTNVNYALDVLKSLDANDDVMKHVSELTNNDVNTPNSIFFNVDLFNSEFYGDDDWCIDVIDDSGEQTVKNDEDKEVHFRNSSEVSLFADLLRKKIKEMKEALNPFISIREDLSERIDYCKNCCIKEYVQEEEIIDIIDVETKRSLSEYSFNFQDFVTSHVNINPDDVSEKTNNKPLVPSPKVDSCICDEEYQIDDLQYLETQLTNIANSIKFYEVVLENLTNQLEGITIKRKSLEFVGAPKMKKVRVTELCSWNNEQTMIDIQKHCFKNRNFEDMVNFNVGHVLFGKRKELGNVADYENMCQTFLVACSKGNKHVIAESLAANVHPNLCDAKGNNGIFYASTENQLEVIPLLVNYGANLDQINDECLTPLAHTLLRYLAIKNMTDDWEKAFLSGASPSTTQDLTETWYKTQSSVNLSSTSSKISMEQGSFDLSNTHIKDLFLKIPIIQQNESLFSIREFCDEYIFDLGYKDQNVKDLNEAGDTEAYSNKLKCAYFTIMTLLEYGSNPNATETPYPPLILSLFSENRDIVQQLLESNANCNITVTEDHLNCLHILCSISKKPENVKICQILLQNKCNPNLRTNPTHWKEQRDWFIGSANEDLDVEDCGKNALHLLCMRQDFANDDCEYFINICRLLIEFGVDLEADYLGHNALSLATLVGNIPLVKYLLKSNVIDPYLTLPFGMGNISTLHALKRFENHLPIDKCKELLTILFDYDFNFLNPIADAENAVAFIETGDLYVVPVTEKNGKKPDKPKKNPKIDKHSQASILTEFLRDLSRKTIIKKIQTYSTNVLYDFAEEDILRNEEISVYLAEFLTPDIVLKNIKDLLQYGVLSYERLDPKVCLDVLEFVNIYKKVTVSKKDHSQKTKKAKNPGPVAVAVPEEKMEDLLFKANFPQSFIVVPTKILYIVKPGLDDSDKYKICFHCLKGRGKVLKLCPRCEQIYFCSSQCNKLNLKLKTAHYCQLQFYDVAQETPKTQHLEALAVTANKKCLERLMAKREVKLKEEEARLIKMWKADIYGTKFLKLRALLQKSMPAREVNWNLAGLQALIERDFKKIPDGRELISIETIKRKLSQAERLRSLSSLRGPKYKELEGETKEQRRKSTDGARENIGNVPDHTKINRRPRKTAIITSLALGNEKPLRKFPVDKVPVMVAEKSRVEIEPTVKKLRRIPPKFQKYVEALATYFPDMDFTGNILPYACCTDGQLYYKFCENDHFKPSYSFS